MQNTPKDEKQGISNWIFSTRLKLKSAIDIHDNLKISYIIITNAWKVLEAIWALNNKPMPPSSSAFRMAKQLKVVPNDFWFEGLFLGDTNDKAIVMLKIIDWALPLLDK